MRAIAMGASRTLDRNRAFVVAGAITTGLVVERSPSWTMREAPAMRTAPLRGGPRSQRLSTRIGGPRPHSTARPVFALAVRNAVGPANERRGVSPCNQQTNGCWFGTHRIPSEPGGITVSRLAATADALSSRGGGGSAEPRHGSLELVAQARPDAQDRRSGCPVGVSSRARALPRAPEHAARDDVFSKPAGRETSVSTRRSPLVRAFHAEIPGRPSSKDPEGRSALRLNRGLEVPCRDCLGPALDASCDR